MPKDAEQTVARLAGIRAAVAALGPILVGDLLEKRNRRTRKDGSVYVSEPYYTFQYRRADGQRAWRRIPRPIRAAVMRMVKDGKRFGELQAEYAALSNALSLTAAAEKKTAPMARPAQCGHGAGRRGTGRPAE